MNKEHLQTTLEPLNKGLKARGREIRIVSVAAPNATVALDGFCCESCNCIDAFKARVSHMIKEADANISNIIFA